MSLSVAIRADASLKTGSGHVRRCLALAGVLRQDGAKVQFICKNHQGNLIDFVRLQNFDCHVIEVNTPDHEPEFDGRAFHSELDDAKQTLAMMSGQKIDWMIVDHYSLGPGWECAARSVANRVFVIDDFVSRPHDCDLILNQTFGIDSGSYDQLVPANCHQLLGAEYALLRPEFAEYRKQSLERRSEARLNHIMMNLGGMDNDNVTSQVLQSLMNTEMPSNCRMTIVMGDQSPHIEEVRRLSMAMSCSTEVRVSVQNMAELMALADIAIGAAGTSAWERCCMGLPTLLLVLADNQQTIAEKLKESQAVILVKHFGEIASYLEMFSRNRSKLFVMSQFASKICDGKGADRVAAHLRE